MRLRTKDTTSIVGNALGKIIDWDASEESRLGTTIGVRVLIDICKPLKRGMMIGCGENGPKKSFFKYEILGNFCYCCGSLDHNLKKCKERDGGAKENLDSLPFGP